jgi:hypothetical protein
MLMLSIAEVKGQAYDEQEYKPDIFNGKFIPAECGDIQNYNR